MTGSPVQTWVEARFLFFLFTSKIKILHTFWHNYQIFGHQYTYCQNITISHLLPVRKELKMAAVSISAGPFLLPHIRRFLLPLMEVELYVHTPLRSNEGPRRFISWHTGSSGPYRQGMGNGKLKYGTSWPGIDSTVSCLRWCRTVVFKGRELTVESYGKATGVEIRMLIHNHILHARHGTYSLGERRW